MTTGAAFGRSTAAPPSASRPLRRPRGTVAGVLPVLAAAALGLPVPVAGQTTQIVLAVCAPAAVAVLLLVRASATGTPAGWRWYSVSLVLASLGSIAVPMVTGIPESTVIGVLPGRLVGAVAVLHMAPFTFWRTGRGRVLTTGTLFFSATLLALDLAASLVPGGPGEPVLLRVAVQAVPFTVALSTAAALLFLAGSEAARRPVAVSMLTAMGLASCTGTAALFVWGTGSPAAAELLWPTTLASLAAVVLACLRDRPVPAPAAPAWSVPDATTSLLPHAMAFTAGGAALLESALSSAVDVPESAAGLVMLATLVAHQKGFVFSRPLEADRLTVGDWRTGGEISPPVGAR